MTTRLEPWGEDDLSLLHALLGDPVMTEHLGGPEAPERIVERHARYLGAPACFKVSVDGDGPRAVHAFPTPGNHASNAVCRKLGFEFVGEVEFEYPKGVFSPCNDWRYDLSR